MNALDAAELTATTTASMSEWLRAALAASAGRDPLTAAEDAVMLADLFFCGGINTLKDDSLLVSPLLGPWLREAIAANLIRPRADSDSDSRALRDILLRRLVRIYAAGGLAGPGVELRVSTLMGRFDPAGEAGPWHERAARHLIDAAGRADAGQAGMLAGAAEEDGRGDAEMAGMLRALATLPTGDLRDELRRMALVLMTGPRADCRGRA